MRYCHYLCGRRVETPEDPGAHHSAYQQYQVCVFRWWSLLCVLGWWHTSLFFIFISILIKPPNTWNKTQISREDSIPYLIILLLAQWPLHRGLFAKMRSSVLLRNWMASTMERSKSFLGHQIAKLPKVIIKLQRLVPVLVSPHKQYWCLPETLWISQS